MHRLFAVFALVAVVALGHSASARDINLRKLATVELQRDSLVQNDSMRTMELITSRRQSLGSFQSIRLYDILSTLPELRDAKLTSLIVVCESSDGGTCTASFAELDPSVAKLPPLLLLNPNTEKSKDRDSFALSDKKGSRGKVDISSLENRFGRVTRLRYTLNDVELEASDRKQLASQNMRVLFPYDRSLVRWLPDIVFIHVYIAE